MDWEKLLQTIEETLPQVLLYLAISPAVVGLLRWFKARLQGRQGPSPVQPYSDLWKLFHRQAVLPETASWVFLSAPLIVFGCYALIGALAPVVYLPSAEQISQDQIQFASGPPLADFLVIVSLIGLAHFAIALAGMDSGSPLGGMGGSREMFMHVLAEPVLLMVAYGLALNTSTTSLSGIMVTRLTGQGQATNLQPATALMTILVKTWSSFSNPFLTFICIALILVMLAETGRVPFDNPAGHLELAMIHQAVRLEYGGHNLALLEWAEAMRLTFFLTLLLNLFFPAALASPEKQFFINPFWTNSLLILLYPLKLLVITGVLAFMEEMSARMRLRGAIRLGGLALAFAVFAIFLEYATRYILGLSS